MPLGTLPRGSMVAFVAPDGSIDTVFDVSPSGDLVWGQYRAGSRELWAASVR